MSPAEIEAGVAAAEDMTALPAAARYGLRSLLVARTVLALVERLPRCGRAMDAGLCGRLATVRGHVESLAQADDGDPMAGNSMASRPWVARCVEHAAGLHDVEPLAGVPLPPAGTHVERIRAEMERAARDRDTAMDARTESRQEGRRRGLAFALDLLGQAAKAG